jgi:hypothetical protein
VTTDAGPAIEAHVRAFFAGHDVEVVEHDLGFPRRRRIPGFRVLVVAPGPRLNRWTYVTVGCWFLPHHVEFVMDSPRRKDSIIALLGRVAYHHATHELDVGGLPGAHLLVAELSQPGLENCPTPDGHIRLLRVTGS